MESELTLHINGEECIRQLKDAHTYDIIRIKRVVWVVVVGLLVIKQLFTLIVRAPISSVVVVAVHSDQY